MLILCVNAGSSSLKLSLIDSDDQTVAEHELAAARGRIDLHALRAALGDRVAEVDAVAHRIVHGGERFRSAVRVDPAVKAALGELVALAPLHQPKSLAALDAVSAALPGVPAVACFDTAFHSTLPASAATYALPADWRRRWNIRRYGFHGLSHAWVARRVRELLELSSRKLRIVSCHLGAGASLCAIRDGHSVDTTMGFTPLAGLVMATRSGDVDPGLLLWLLERERLTESELMQALEHESGLLGLCGTADMREVIDRAGAEDSARLAFEVYIHRLRAGIAAMTAALGGLDVLTFTGGVGERSSEVRSRATEGLGFLGVGLDQERNRLEGPDLDITAPAATVRVLKIHAREDLEMVRQTRQLLGADR